MEKIRFKEHRYTIMICALFALIYISPLLLLDTFYADDLWKFISGSGWPDDARPLATGMSQFFSGSEKIKDLSPFTTIATVIITALAGYCITLIANIEQSGKIKITALVLLTSPFFIENLSFKYDGVIFAFAFLFMILPFFFVGSQKKFIVFSVIGIFLTTITYQASLTVYMLMTVLVAVSYNFEKPLIETLKFIGTALLSFVLGILLVYLFGIVFPMETARSVTIFQEADAVASFNTILESCIAVTGSVFNSHYSVVLTVIVIVFLISLIKFFAEKKIKIQNKLLTLLLVLVAPFLVFFILLIFPKATVMPRTFVGFSIFIYILLVMIDRYFPRITPYLAIMYVLIALPLMTSMTKYRKVQNEFQAYVVTDIVQHVPVNNKEIVFEGQIPTSQNADIAKYGYTMFNYMYVNYLGNENFLFNEYFKYKTHNLYALTFPLGDKRLEILKEKANYPIVYKTNFYFVRAYENKVIIDFNKQGIEPATLTGLGTLNEGLKHNVDQFEQNGQELKILGWAYLENQDTSNTNIKVALINTATNEVFTTQVVRQKRLDVSLSNKGNYDDCGFLTTVNLNEITNGSYKLALVLQNATSLSYVVTSKTIEVNHEQKTPEKTMSQAVP